MKKSLFEEKLLALCLKKGITLGTAESCTGGALAARITSVAGASQYFVGSIVSYTNIIKTRLLRVPAPVLEQYGAVSVPVVLMMLEGVFTQFSCDLGIAITGVAGPTGGSLETPVGTVYIAFGRKASSPEVLELHLSGDRSSIISETVEEALNILIKTLQLPA